MNVPVPPWLRAGKKPLSLRGVGVALIVARRRGGFWENNLIRPIGSRQPLLEAGEALQQFVKTGFFTLRERAQK